MRILQISSASSFGGGERYVADLATELARRGHDLFVALRPHSPLISHLKLPPGNIKELPLRNAFDAGSARQLDRLVKQHELEIIHAHMARDYPLAAYAAKRNPSTKFFVTRHVLFPLNRFHRRTLLGATRVIAVSQAVARQLSSQNLVDEERIAVVSNGVDVKRFTSANFDRDEFRKRKGLPVGRLIVGSIGELRNLKRHDDFIRAAALVVKKQPNTYFVIAGVDTSPQGEVRKRLTQLVAHLQLEKDICFLGWLDDAEQLLQALDVFVSASETESFGLAIAEAMAAGTAVVATKTEGALEVVADQETGLLVPIGDVEQMAGAITTLLTHAEKRASIGKRAHEVVTERFSLSRMVDEIEQLYLH